MAIQFQPKIIIGSVVGFIATAIGVIAVFFPSLFNLEQKKIDNLTITLDTCTSVQKLYDFLKNHQGKVVTLDMTYKFTNMTDGNGKWMFNEEGYNDLGDTDLGYEKEDDLGVIGKPQNSYFGENNLFNARAPYRRDYHHEWMFQENGGFGFWCKNSKTNKSKQEYHDIEFQIDIPYSSNNNKVYYWGYDVNDKIENTNSPEWEGFMEHLKGTFLVGEVQDAHSYGQKTSFMHPSYTQEMNGRWGEWITAPQIFALEPLTKKDLELKNY